MDNARVPKKYKNITQPDAHGFQVRIVRDGVTHSKYFSHRSWGGKRKSLSAAINWRDMQKAVLPKKRKCFDTMANNRTTGVVGVSKTIHYDKRRDASYLRFQVFYQTNDGKPAVKTFQVGNIRHITADEEFHAFRTALRFRFEYRAAREADAPFNAARFDDWKRRRLY